MTAFPQHVGNKNGDTGELTDCSLAGFDLTVFGMEEEQTEEATAGRPGRRLTRTCFDFLSVSALHLFARYWHGCARGPSSALLGAGPAIIVANHCNYSDPAFLTSACRRPLAFLHARESYDTPLLRYLFRGVGSIPVSRTGRNVSAIRTALRRLREGATLCIFPEGQVSPSGLRGCYKAGAAFLALHSRAPVYPAQD